MPPPKGPREPIAGPDVPEPPFPLKLSGTVIKGFGRGSKELGIPTANIPIEGLSVGGNDQLQSGIYYGWAGLDFSSANGSPAELQHGQQHPDESMVNKAMHTGSRVVDAVGNVLFGSPDENVAEEWEGQHRVHPMVVSIGYNPFYKNTVRSVEVHLLHAFTHDFYGAHLNLMILGFIRPEYDYVDKDSLVKDIRTDIEVAGRSLARPAYARWERDGFLTRFGEGDVGS
ncbi:uncharacterized protein K452DRAFT_292751 [Aplosporella prunicola CBS 121167]|uniref:Riboflavin kinase n=1 Tax=Aplosporella prunicola CBS 121167 TaxID=1176127 RepID=A0A6A6AZY5_9PEZI|nr:uncharacterized protein K452DRAFT_292751 [Aplosporella prunicola CBS 121167]KAF2136031.1 hypothetical protein K452DRAFT_292751 [Aplosporella prunicola CBS 121167]